MGRFVLITGAAGGIGSEILSALLGDPAVEHVFAASRSGLGPRRRKLTWLQLDYLQPSTIGEVAAKVAAAAPRIDWLIGATGLLHADSLQPEKELAGIQAGVLDHLYRVNAAGPLALLGACVPLLKAAPRPKVAMLSAQVGSISDNSLGGWYGYRMAKAALNMGLKSAAIEAARWRNHGSIVAVHPGTTLTRLSAPFVARRKKSVRSAAATAALIHQLMHQIDTEQNGGFLTAEGEVLPW